MQPQSRMNAIMAAAAMANAVQHTLSTAGEYSSGTAGHVCGYDPPKKTKSEWKPDSSNAKPLSERRKILRKKLRESNS